ncbi:MAG: decaprenyl-phosphate phosphoribosyltransferase [Microthrixaceae bacterium]|nr:decaprenyl-phosphate phosphoribosyltransferase [Microthrixaceae bacterium]
MTSQSLLRGLVREARPKQWAKNVLVFVAPAAAGVLNPFESTYYLRLTVVGFVAFCLVSSATYVVNDILDVESDRAHPTKRNRPIAAGVVPVGVAVVVAVLMFTTGVVLALFNRGPDAEVNWALGGIVAGYAVLTTTYSLWLKRVVVLDLVILSAGFILRLLGGAFAAGVDVSDWFLVISLFGSMFIAAAKRHAEAAELGAQASTVRATLGEYSPAYLNMVQTIAASGTVISYCLWAVEAGSDASVTTTVATPWAQLSIIPLVIAVLRYALLVDKGEGAAPEDVILHDRQMQLMGALLAACIFIGGVRMSMTREVLTGWGRTAPSAARVVAARGDDEVASALASVDARGLVARGSGAPTATVPRTPGGWSWMVPRTRASST